MFRFTERLIALTVGNQILALPDFELDLCQRWYAFPAESQPLLTPANKRSSRKQSRVESSRVIAVVFLNFTGTFFTCGFGSRCLGHQKTPLDERGKGSCVSAFLLNAIAFL